MNEVNRDDLTEERVRGLFAVAGFAVLKLWQLPNGYLGDQKPLTVDQIQRDTPGRPGYSAVSDTGPTEGVVMHWMADYRWRYERPWWLVLTPQGPIEIGWRKRVIHIDWSQTALRYDGITTDETTKSSTLVHAWSLEKAASYLTALARYADAERSQV